MEEIKLINREMTFEEYLRLYCMPTRSIENDYEFTVLINDGEVEL